MQNTFRLTLHKWFIPQMQNTFRLTVHMKRLTGLFLQLQATFRFSEQMERLCGYYSDAKYVPVNCTHGAANWFIPSDAKYIPVYCTHGVANWFIPRIQNTFRFTVST